MDQLSWLENVMLTRKLRSRTQQQQSVQTVAISVSQQRDYTEKPTLTGFALLHMQKDARCQQQQLSLERKRCACLSSCLFPVTRISEYSHNLLLYNFDENVTLTIALKYISRSVPGLSSLTYFVTCFQNGSIDAAVCLWSQGSVISLSLLWLLTPLGENQQTRNLTGSFPCLFQWQF